MNQGSYVCIEDQSWMTKPFVQCFQNWMVILLHPENPFTASAVGPFYDLIKYSNFCTSAKAELSTTQTLIDWL